MGWPALVDSNAFGIHDVAFGILAEDVVFNRGSLEREVFIDLIQNVDPRNVW